jgi:Bacterial archaeo-eukaryotic release factor family 10
MHLDRLVGETRSMALEAKMLREIARMEDPVGVLTVCVDIAPHEAAGRMPLWEEQVRVGLEHLADGMAGAGAAALRARLNALEPSIERLLDPRTPGRGRALFAAVTGEEIHEARIALPLATDVRLERRAHLLPLLAAAQRGRVLGVAVVSSDELRLLELEMGEGRELRRIDLSQPGFEWSLRKEPNAGVVENLHRIADIAAPEVERSARAHGWDDVVVVGTPRIALRLADSLTRAGLSVHTHDADPAPEVTVTTIAGMCGADSDASRQAQDQQLVERVREQAAADGRGALGLADVAAALAEGRIDHLVLDTLGTYPGTVTGDGRLVAAGPTPATPVVDLAGELIERAFETDAEVTAVSGSAAQALSSCGGIGALLRW